MKYRDRLYKYKTPVEAFKLGSGAFPDWLVAELKKINTVASYERGLCVGITIEGDFGQNITIGRGCYLVKTEYNQLLALTAPEFKEQYEPEPKAYTDAEAMRWVYKKMQEEENNG